MPRLAQGGLFRLVDFAAFPHCLRLPPGALLDALAALSPLRSALGSTWRRAFGGDVQRLVERHFGACALQAPAEAQQQLASAGGSGSGGDAYTLAEQPSSSQRWVELPLYTKAYVLAKAPASAAASLCATQPSGRQAGGQSCLFCAGGATAE